METRIKDKIGEGGARGKLFLETLRSNIPTMAMPVFTCMIGALYNPDQHAVANACSVSVQLRSEP